ncbi:MAG: hypothetical protein N2445_06830, partial [Acidobacteria bacterium]|nr:hypothetical protein [Acidobacteriota bacterium]
IYDQLSTEISVSKVVVYESEDASASYYR